MLYQLLTNAAMGWITGYVTNKYAVDMLFDKKFGLGGVILKKHKEFAESFGMLVERDLINQRTIQQELKKKKVQDAIYNTFFYALDTALYNKLKNSSLRLCDLPGVDESSNNILHFFGANAHEISKKLSTAVCKKVYVEDILTEKQIENISEALCKEIIKVLKRNAPYYTNEIYKDISNTHIKDLLTENVGKKIKAGFLNCASDYHKKFKNLSEIDEFLTSVFDCIELDALLCDIEDKLKKRELKDIIVLDNDIKAVLNDILNSDKFKLNLEKLIGNMLELLKNSDMRIVDLLGKDIEKRLFEYIDDKLPYILEEIIAFINDKKFEIEGIIENSIEEHLKNNAWAGEVKLLLKNYFIGSISKEFNLLDKIIKWIELHEKDKQLSQKITKDVIDYLQKNTIGSIVADLEKQGLINTSMIADVIHNNIQLMLDEMDSMHLNSLLKEKSACDVFCTDISGFVKNFIKSHIKEYLYSPKVSEFVKSELNANLQKLFSSKVYESGLKPEHIHPAVLRLLSANEDKIKKAISNRITCFVKDKKLLEYQDIIYNIDNFIKTQTAEFIKQQLEVHKQKKLSSYADYLKNHSDYLAYKLTALTLDMLSENMNLILKNRVSAVIAQQMKRYPPEIIRDKAQEFMGKELKPITYLGAFLGTVAGSSVYLFQHFSGIAAGYYALLVNPLVYAFTGVATNWLAIKMLFKPYKAIYLGNIKLPFTPGVVGKNKARFARRTAEFIHKELLNEEMLAEKLLCASDENKVNAIKYVLENNYDVVNRFATHSAEKWEKKTNTFVVKRAFLHFNKNRIVIAESLSDKIASAELKDIGIFDKDLKLLLHEQTHHINSLLKKKSASFIKTKSPLIEFIPAELMEVVMEKINKSIEKRLDETLMLFLQKLNSDDELKKALFIYFEKLKHKKLNEIIPEQLQRRLKQELVIYILNAVKSERESLFNVIEKSMEFIFTKQKRANFAELNCVETSLSFKLMLSNMDYIKRITLDSFVNKACEYLKSQESVISDSIKKNIVQKDLFTWLVSGLFGIDKDIDVVVRDLVRHKIPDFLHEEQENLKKIIDNFWYKQLKAENTQQIKFFDHLLKEAFENIFNYLLNDEKSQMYIKSFLEGIIDDFLNVELESIFWKSFSEDFFEIFEPELEIFKNHMSEKIYENKKQLIFSVNMLTAAIVSKTIFRASINQIFSKINEKDIDVAIDNITDLILKSNSFERAVFDFNEKVLLALNRKKLKDLIIIDLLKDDISKVLEKLIHSDAFKSEVKDIIQPVLLLFMMQFINLIEEELKYFIAETLFESIIASVQKNAKELAHSADIQNIIEQAVNDMNSKEIEDMFYAFAGDYFKRLILYGSFGGVFGLPSAAAALA
ncbi:DUF445 family protein [Peptococcaceae bacterium]|nr:DUF445 family protein [Peptococcaceae bacterium]